MYLFKICGIIFLVILAVSLMVLGLIYQDPFCFDRALVCCLRSIIIFHDEGKSC